MTGETRAAQALWIAAPKQAELRDVQFDVPDGHVVIDTMFTGISRGTERLVFEGRVPESENQTMRAPFQEGEFPGPVKYGYAGVGRIAQSDDIVFALFPHQTAFAIPPEAAVPVPPTVPAERAVLAANMETALNILWDAGVQPGDRVAIVGSGVVGALVGYLSARIPGTEVCLIDIVPGRAALADALGCDFAEPQAAGGDADVVIHASATAAGLATAISLAGLEAAIVEASWYGTGTVDAPLGGRFHQRRLRLVGSQVGRIPPSHAARWTYRRRLQKALDLLADPALDVLISGETQFTDLVRRYEGILADPATLCHRVRFGG
ncbi:zinc-dependent alcohol dehydrogenase [Jannaschia pohangensis]|uniref:Threonine dehydrogenase n=1 Tax=Jannaschia pohangensis TaxID=390807 RepID=A0A1I3NWW0_9RHOB|nr:zinc-binding alcohol dehydrogenase [Jannaschia pohangensis]SFJ13701.1 Threonine dehydrogenase [Jannaschia pohangensis]